MLFRVALGVLKVNARCMLSITDPVGLFQTLKEIAKHSFEIDHSLKVRCIYPVLMLYCQFIISAVSKTQ